MLDAVTLRVFDQPLRVAKPSGRPTHLFSEHEIDRQPERAAHSAHRLTRTASTAVSSALRILEGADPGIEALVALHVNLTMRARLALALARARAVPLAA